MADLQLTIRADNLRRVQKALDSLTGAQAKAAYANAIEDTAKQARKRMQDEMRQTFDRPTPWMLKSVSYKVDRDKLSATILPTYYNAKPVDPQKVLQAQAWGGQRRAKGFERVLQRAGILPPGWVTTPGQGAQMDAYGGMSGGQIKQILSQLALLKKGNMAKGAKGAKAQAKAGGRFFVVPVGGPKQPGIYQREFLGRTVTPVLIFVRSASYKERPDFDKLTQGSGLQDYLDKRVRYRIRNLAEGKSA